MRRGSTVALVLLAAGSAAAAPRRLEGSREPAVVESTLPVTKADAYQALLEALATWTMRKTDLAQGIVKTEWDERAKRNEIFRHRVVAELVEEGYTVRLTVRHEKQRKRSDLGSPSLGGPNPGWEDWDGDFDIARAVVDSVEQALGITSPTIPVSELGQQPKASPVPQLAPEPAIAPEVAPRVVELKARRRELVREIKAIDQRVLTAVYEGRQREIAGELDQLKARKAALEKQVVEIDKEILALVLAE